MKKYYFLLTIIFCSNIFSYSLLYIGEVESRQWNDSWDRFYDYPLTVYAGGNPDGSERTVLIKIKNSFGDDYYKYFRSQKCNERQIKKKQCYENGYTINYEYDNLYYILNKSIEWSRIAKENNVEKVSKNIQYEGKNIRSPFGGGNARFFAQGDYQSDLILPAYFPLIDAEDRYYDLDAQENFLKHLSKVTETIDRSLEENKKSDDLFN
jgi:hypothetical protein|tara:strand:- start:354 stop:980 length:627 start_codon:yes stop_codon:yes gene_type:complete